MKFIQHIPDWADGFEPAECQVKDLDELLTVSTVRSYNIPWVEKGKTYPFFRYSITPNFYSPTYQGKKTWDLIAEYDEGSIWWVIGTIDEQVDLPEWKPNWERCQEREGADCERNFRTREI